MARRRLQQAYEVPAVRMVHGTWIRCSGTARARRCVACMAAAAAGTPTSFIFMGYEPHEHAYNGFHRADDLRVLEQHLLHACYRCIRSGDGGRMRLIAVHHEALISPAYQLHERSSCCLNLNLPYGCHMVPCADFGAPRCVTVPDPSDPELALGVGSADKAGKVVCNARWHAGRSQSEAA